MSDELATIPKRALVTGASSGIGEAFARRLARDGYDLALVARRGEVLEQLAKQLAEEHDASTRVVVADLAVAGDLARVEDLVRGGAFGLVVNNAGFGTQGRFHELDLETETRMLRLNVEALVRLTHAALGTMVPRNAGAIINVSSGAAFVPAATYATYAATKAFVSHFTEAIAEEQRGSRVKLQALCPGFTRTEFQDRAGVDASQIPDFLWMEADAVVAASLDGLARGTLVCVPGVANRALPLLTGSLVRPLLRRAMASLSRGRRKT